MSLPVCKFYITNQSCRFGRNCRYLHPDSQRPPPSNNLPENQHEDPVNSGYSVLLDQISESEVKYHNEESVNKVSYPLSSGDTVADPSDFISCTDRNTSHDLVISELPLKSNRPHCFNYARNGKCIYGINCRYSHDVQSGLQSQNGRSNGKKGNKICHFFKSNRCDSGNRCRFRHPAGILNDKDNNEHDGEHSPGKRITNRNEKKARMPKRRQQRNNKHGFNKRKYLFTLAEAEEEGISKLRQSEIIGIHKQFTNDEITIVKDSDTEFTALIKFTPSDPEWPFDITLFEIQISIPTNYPVEMLTIKLPTDQDLPETIRRYTDITIGEWLEEKVQKLESNGQVELVFIPFFEWLDCTIEEVTTEAMKQLKRELMARAAGVQIFSPKQLQEKLKIHSDESDEDSSGESDVSDSEDDDTDECSESEESDDGSDGQTESASDLDPHKKGTEIELRDLQLKDNASDLMFHRLKVVLQCLRCKDHKDLLVHKSRVVSTSCGKCSQAQFVNFRPALVHQFSSILGYLDLDGCHAFDLVLPDCQALITCMGCSKQTRLEGLVSGQMIDGWCQACNAKFKLAIESVKLTQLMPLVVDTAVQKMVEVAPAKSKKPPKNPAIRDGCPLPEFGTCRHFKHSYRWLRFPCCGKAYPCDVCHDKKEDHEHIFANRMICGHCCKEQNFSPLRPCNSCDQHMTKVRSAHWEGGQGCRDKMAMSRTDTQKYRSQNKTTSNHKKNLQSKGNKSVKLRHS